MQELEGFYSDETGGDWIEIISLWQGQIWDVRHQRSAGAPEAWRSLATSQSGFSDSETGMTHWFREVGEPVPVASDPRGVLAGLTMAALIPFFAGLMLVTALLLSGGAGSSEARALAFGFSSPEYGPIRISRAPAPARSARAHESSSTSAAASASVSHAARPRLSDHQVRTAGMLSAFTALDAGSWQVSNSLSAELDDALSGLIEGEGPPMSGGPRVPSGGSSSGFVAGASCDVCPGGPGRRVRRGSASLGIDAEGGGAPGNADIDLGDDDVVVVDYDKRYIETVIRKHLDSIRYCYERELRGNDVLAGRLGLAFTIDSEGHVPVAKVATSSMGDNTRLHECVVDVFERMRFPPPRHTVVVRYPIFFKPTGV